jgi:HNH endonuclease
MEIVIKGFAVLIDDADAAAVLSLPWRPKRRRSTPSEIYFQSTIKGDDGTWRNIFLHRFLLNAPPRQIVDHKNGNTLDYRRGNLRFATHSQNTANRHVILSSSGFKGVTRHKTGKWQAAVKVSGRSLHLGLFATPEDAAAAYDEAVSRHYGEFATTNAQLRREHVGIVA